ncbi:MAG TPA: hypothetical protein VGB83_03805 [Actinomycetota bacterium]
MTDLRLIDLLAAISVATDLGMGQAPEKAIRSCLLATGLARGMDLPEEEVRERVLDDAPSPPRVYGDRA